MEILHSKNVSFERRNDGQNNMENNGLRDLNFCLNASFFGSIFDLRTPCLCSASTLVCLPEGQGRQAGTGSKEFGGGRIGGAKPTVLYLPRRGSYTTAAANFYARCHLFDISVKNGWIEKCRTGIGK